MEDNKTLNTDRQKAKELAEKFEEGMAGLRSSMETMRRNVEDFISGMESAIRNLQEEWESESDKAVDRQKEDESEKTYQEVEVFGVPALFDNARILPEDVPEGLLLYDLRGSDDDPGDPATVERHVLVNHAASILTAVPLPVPEQGALRLGEELNFVGGMVTAREFMEGHSGIDMDSLMENMENAICHENEGLFLKPSAEYGRYAIYQINEDAVKENYLFMNLERVKSKGIEVRGEDYSLVYGGKLSENVTLEMLFEKFNISRPEGFRGHSLSVSDVVVTNRGGEVNAYYVDSFGYAKLPEFVKQRQNLPEPEQNEMEQSGVGGSGQTVPDLDDEDELIDLGDEREKVLAEMKGILESNGEKDDDAVAYFKAKTEELFHSISDMNPSEIEETVKCHVQAKIDESGIDAVIVDVALTGSRCRGLEKNVSDLDVVVELATDEREDDLFALFNEGSLHIGEVAVDINPITAQRTGTLETYLPQAEEYLEELRRARENEPVSLFNIRMNGGERWYRNTSGMDVKGLCKAYAECGNPLADMGKYGERMEAADYDGIEQGERLDFSIEFNDETGKITIFDGEDFICRGMRETLFLQQMENEPDTATELAVKFDCLSHDRDAALYHESVESMDENVSEIAGAIRQGDTGHLTAWLANILTGDAAVEEMERAAALLERLNDYKPLAKIEEMEEQNYNMVDNVLNNGAGEKAQKEEHKKKQEPPVKKISLKARLAEKKEIVSGQGKGHEVQDVVKKEQKEM